MSDHRPHLASDRPSGRRRGDSGTREIILDAAKEMFSESGYDATSVRAIATRAAVDPGLVRYFFTDKETLFATTMAQRTEIPGRIADALNGDPGTLGHRLTDTYLGLWEDPGTSPILSALFRSAMSTPRAVQMFIETLSGAVHPDSPFPHPGHPRSEGFALAATHLFGIAIARHILKLPVITDLTHQQIVDRVSPEIQRYLSAPAD